MKIGKNYLAISIILLLGACGGGGGSEEGQVAGDTTGEQNDEPSVDNKRIVFSENFEDELISSGGSILNYTGFSDFSVEGSVDLIATNTYGIDCAVGNSCVDLDGTTGGDDPASVMTSIPIHLDAGDYVLTLYLGGNQRASPSSCLAADSVTVGFDGFFDQVTYTLDSSEEVSAKDITFTIQEEGESRLVITQLGMSDFCGAILDDISLAKINGD